MVTNVTSLLKTVKAVEDEHTRGTRALESTVEAIGQEMRVSCNVHGDFFEFWPSLNFLIFCVNKKLPNMNFWFLFFDSTSDLRPT